MIGVVINFEIVVGIIVDGIYVVDDMVGFVLCVWFKKDFMFFVFDVMFIVGGFDYFNFYGMDVMFVDGCLVNVEGNFVGVYVIMVESVV